MTDAAPAAATTGAATSTPTSNSQSAAGTVNATAQAAANAGAKATSDPNIFIVKVDGKEQQVSREELIRGYSTASAAHERMRAANETRQQAEEVLKIFKENPKLAMQKLGMDAKAFAESVLNEHLEDLSLTEEQRELKKLRSQMKEFAEKEEQAKIAEQQRAEQAFREKVTQDMQNDIIGALQTSGLPRNEYTVGRIAYYMEAAITAGYPNISAKDVMPYVRNEYEKDVKSLLGSLDEGQIESFLGKDVSKKVLKASLGKVKATPVVKTQGVKGNGVAAAKPKVIGDFFKQRRQESRQAKK